MKPSIRACLRFKCRHKDPIAGVRVTGLLILTIMLGGYSNSAAAQEEPSGSHAYRRAVVERYVIQVGDMLGVRIFGFPTLAQNLEVRSDGKIAVDPVGEVLAAGLTPAELDSLLTAAFAERIVSPELTIIMWSFREQTVFVGGRVRRPGQVWIRPGLTALQAIVLSGGHAEEARMGSVILVRSTGDGSEIMELDLRAVAETGARDTMLQPYDILYVPETTIVKVDRFVAKYLHHLIPKNFQAKLKFAHDLNPESNVEEAAVLP